MLRTLLKGTAVVLAIGMAASVAASADEGISIANGKVKFDTVDQFWFVNDTSLDHQYNSTGGANRTPLNMYVRRAEMQFSGGLSDTTHWFLMIDPARALTVNQGLNGSNYQILQDFGISYDLMVPGLTATVGQFKTLTVSESLDPDGELLLPERSMVARTWGEARQPGAMISYKTQMWKIAGMISNGGNTLGNNIYQDGSNLAALTQNAHDPNSPDNRDLTFRFDIKPMDMVSAGAFVYLPGYNMGQGGAFGGNARVMPMEDLMVRGEYVRGWVRGAGGDNLARNGYYVDAAYQYGDFQPVFRWEAQQQNTYTLVGGTPTLSNNAGGVVTGSAATFGLNYYMNKHNSKVQFAYSWLSQNMSGSDAITNLAGGTTYSPATGQYAPMAGGGGGVATLAFQFAI